jgi:hypothetical protein
VVEGAQVLPERPEDLRDELNRRRAGKDARISLERARERRGNIEGHNLEQDFAAVAPQAPGDAQFQASIPLAGVGCAALANHLCTVIWPPKFRQHLPEEYNGTTNPSEFLQVYVTTITAAGGDTVVMATYFHVALIGPAQTWLMNQAPGSIYSWEELYAWFVANIADACQQHGVEAHLHAVRQEPGETLRAFISRFTMVRGTIPPISDASIITAVGEEISPAGWRIAPALNPKKRRGLSILLVMGLVDQHTGARKGLEWFGPSERNTLLHCVMYCSGACMNL